jgi:carboxymethylenebutenolidase
VDQHSAGTGYLALPDAGAGRGVLLLHGWWGLTPFFKGVADRLAEAGFVVVAPDLFEGATADTPAEAQRLLAEADPNALAHLVRSGLHHLRSLPVTAAGPCGVVGFAMGASMAVWLSAREPDGVAATVAFYGTQDIDLSGATCAYLGHFAEQDEHISEDDLVFFEASLHLEGHQPDIHRYPGTRQWFFETDRPEHDPEAAAVAWERTVGFLRRHLPPG